jgi:hypothetical protein
MIPFAIFGSLLMLLSLSVIGRLVLKRREDQDDDFDDWQNWRP